MFRKQKLVLSVIQILVISKLYIGWPCNVSERIYLLQIITEIKIPIVSSTLPYQLSPYLLILRRINHKVGLSATQTIELYSKYSVLSI